jgi:hypothetical protein
MTQASTPSVVDLSAAPSFRAGPRSPCGAGGYTAELKTRLSLAPGQVQVWEAFADALSANTHRMRSDNAGGDSPFGPAAHRLDATRGTAVARSPGPGPATRGSADAAALLSAESAGGSAPNCANSRRLLTAGWHP